MSESCQMLSQQNLMRGPAMQTITRSRPVWLYMQWMQKQSAATTIDAWGWADVLVDNGRVIAVIWR
jgi:hypothetical protein